ncbi:MAG: hypothetical protein J5449_02070, partial [Oscillospiraceae bacterium]|nr:hypothetical protein [Oscillospiraceae bacterium]
MKKRAISLLTCLAVIASLLAPVAYAAETVSDWVPVSSVPDGAEIVSRKWTYVTETPFTVNSPNEAGTNARYVSEKWVDTGSGSTYYASIPSGFDTSHWLYSYLNHQAYSAYSTDTTKRSVSNSWAGYVYWHWMYDSGRGNGISQRAILDYCGYGPDTGFYYKYFGAFTSTNGNYSSDRYYCNSRSITNYIIPEKYTWDECQGATRWFRFDYYCSTYTDSKKVYNYVRIGSGETDNYSNIPSNAVQITEYVKYRIHLDDCPAPRAVHLDGSRLLPTDKIELFCDVAGATIYYALSVDGGTSSGFARYTGAFDIPTAKTLMVQTYAEKDGMGRSPTAVFNYTIGASQALPSVSTLNASNVTDTTAVLHAKIESEAPLISVSFLYFEKNNSRSRCSIEVKDGSAVQISGLLPGTEYRVQA